MRSFQATRFREPTKRGLTRPFIVEGRESSEGTSETLVVKSRAGYEAQGGLEYMHIEAYCLLLARRLGLTAAEPVAVDLPEGLEFGALDFREYQGTDYHELITESHGANLATVHLGPDWKAWTGTTRPKKIPQQPINDAYCYDAMVQNDDRKQDNPNLLWRGAELALIDFDRAWCLGWFPEEARPWRRALDRLNLRDGCLFPVLKPESGGSVDFGNRLRDRILEEGLTKLSAACIDEVEAAFPGANLDFRDLSDYVTKLAGEPGDFFGYLAAVCPP